MKGTENFKAIIEKHLNGLAENDALFSETLKKPNKNIDDCVTYILNTVKESGCNGFSDDEVFNMAVHYYDEEDIKPGDKISGSVVVNHSVDLTDEEIAAAKDKAYQNIIAEETEKIRKKPAAKSGAKKEETKVKEPSLFD